MTPFSENFREFLDRLRSAGEMIDMRQPVDIRHIATLVDQSDKALFFHNVIGYDMPVVSGIIRSRERTIMAMGCTEYGQIEQRLRVSGAHIRSLGIVRHYLSVRCVPRPAATTSPQPLKA